MPTTRTRKRRPVPVSPALERLGDRLRQARIEAGLSQAKLGEPHFTRAHISAIELGKIRPAMKSLEFLAAKLGKPLSYFLEDEGESQRRRERALAIDSALSLVARPTAKQALLAARRLLDQEGLSPRDIARLRIAAGSALNFLEQPEDAIRELTVAQRLALQVKDEALSRSADFQMAIAVRNAGNYRRARDLFEALLKRLEQSRLPDQVLRMKVLQSIGTVSVDLGEHEVGRSYLLTALEWAKDIGDVSGLLAIYHGLAGAYRAAGDYEAAAGYLQKALGASEVSNDLAMSSILHNALAVLSAEGGRLEAAYRHVDRAIEIAKVSGPPYYLPSYVNTKAECAVKLGDWDGASRFASEAFDLAKHVKNESAVGAARVVLAEVALHRGDIPSGERLLNEAAASYKALDAKTDFGEVLMRLSRVARDRGDTVAAQKFAEQAFRATKATGTLLER